jgi:hypothetical protein
LGESINEYQEWFVEVYGRLLTEEEACELTDEIRREIRTGIETPEGCGVLDKLLQEKAERENHEREIPDERG